jgi:uncharacterized phage protein gp47/JayE
MTTFGLTPEGFVAKTLEDAQGELEDSFRSAFGASLDVSGSSSVGVLIGILADREATMWELAEAVNSAQDPDAATGDALEAIGALTGAIREEARPSTVVLTLTGTNGTTISAGSQTSNPDTAAVFQTTEDVTIATLTAWMALTAYVIGDRVTNASRAYVCTDAGTSAASGGPTTTGSAITDSGVVWRYIGEGVAAGDAAAQCTVNGPTVSVSGTITSIETPVSGWSSVRNLADATAGADEETDQDLRIRREDEISALGSSPADAIRAALLAIDGVSTVKLFVNDTDATVDTVPPHAVEALVIGGDDQDIYDVLLASVAAGIATFGNTSGTATDAEGNEIDVSFTRPEEVNIYADIELIYDADLYPTDGDDQVEAAIVAYWASVAPGRDAVASSTSAQCFQIDGVLDVTQCFIGTAPSPGTDATIAIGVRQVPSFDTSRITITSTPGTP